MDNDKYDEVAGRIATIADVYPFDSIAERRRWEFSFFHPGRMTPNKLQRTSDVEWAHMLSELNALPRKLLERVLCLRSLGESPRRALVRALRPCRLGDGSLTDVAPASQPTADALFLDAFDASQTPQSRFHRFTALLDGILGLYRLAVGEGHQQEDSVRRLADAIETASKSHQKPAFANESLAVQVSGVDEARNLLFETCKHYLTRTLLSPDRVARRISPRSVAMATETDHFEHATQLHLLAQALPGIVLNAQVSCLTRTVLLIPRALITLAPRTSRTTTRSARRGQAQAAMTRCPGGPSRNLARAEEPPRARRTRGRELCT